MQVAQGNVLTAELLRLSGEMPTALRDAQSRFARVLPDFAYLKDASAAERRIEASAPLTALDDEFREVQFHCGQKCRHECVGSAVGHSCICTLYLDAHAQGVIRRSMLGSPGRGQWHSKGWM